LNTQGTETGDPGGQVHAIARFIGRDDLAGQLQFGGTQDDRITPEQPGDSVEVSDVRAVDPDATPAADPEHQHAVASSQQRQDEGSQVGGAPSTADGAHADTERYPCADAPAYTCRAEAPTGAGVVAVHNDGETVTIDQGNNDVDTADAQYDYDATTPARTREEAEAKKEVRDAVNEIPDDQMVVMTAANGQQSSAEQENAFSLEQQLWDRGEPYMVCFDPVTYTSNGEEITVQPDCIIITPD